MKRLIAFVILIQLSGPAFVHAADRIEFASFSNGFSSGGSASYGNTGQTGGIVYSALAGGSLINYSGFIPSITRAPASPVTDDTISFYDESPKSNEVQGSAEITFGITVQITGGNDISEIKYQLSTTGPEALDTMSYSTAGVTMTTLAPKMIRCTVHLTGLSVSNNNYIRFQAINDGGGTALSSKYQISVRAPAVPAIVITQPDAKSGFAAMHPYIEATVSDTDLTLDTGTIAIHLVKAGGGEPAVISLNSSSYPSLYDPAAKIVSYNHTVTSLSPNTDYTLTVSARGKNGTDYSAQVTFTVKGGAIADLVPYPSPFDPRLQPIAIRYVLNKDASVSINIYDMSGRMVRNVVDAGMRKAGVNEDQWAGINYAGETLANGVYFCEVVAKDDEGEHRRHTALAIFGK